MAVITGEITVEIDRNGVWRSMGYSADNEPPARIASLIDEYIENASQLMEPSYTYVIRNVDLLQDSRVLIEGPVVFQSKIIARLLSKCKKVAVLVVTIGDRLEEMARSLARDGLMLQASVLDAIGSNAVVKLADYVQSAIARKAGSEGLVASRRFSPGYCDWDISQQMMIFHAVKRDSIDVDLTDKCLMVPQKSISGIVGLGSPEADICEYNPCTTCDKEDCPGRR